MAAPSPTMSPFRFLSKGWQRSGATAPRRTKPANWSFSMISDAPLSAMSARPARIWSAAKPMA